MTELLRVRNLKVTFETYLGPVEAVRGVDLSIHQGETVAIVGESGCGKSVTARAIMRLHRREQVRVSADDMLLGAHDLQSLSHTQLRRLMGSEMAMVFQDPMSSLNPTMRIGKQIMEVLTQQLRLGHTEARQRAIAALHEVGIPEAERRFDHYPHQFSGGMRQRVMIAIALACRPKLLFADEPTTALDVTIQAQILELLAELRSKLGMSVVLITHDLSVVAGSCDRVYVMYAGRIVEEGTVDQIFTRPQHPYTRALLQAVPNPNMLGLQNLRTIGGSPPNLRTPPSGCSFHPRCPHAMKLCSTHCPPLELTTRGQASACWLHHPHGMETLHPRDADHIDPWIPSTQELA
ncbi:MAG: ABC transporter ATP-binding protein [Chlamydiia bacterium]|nr:ABC transporter ATP-binding protein [Chlamydiia bacterium]